MSSIKPKKGICIDCGPDSPEKTLISGRCQTHYWPHRAAVKAAARKGSEVDKDNQAQKKALDKWFAGKIAAMHSHCEECGEYLNPYAPWGARTYCAHVLPKRNFETVKTHPLNCIYLCAICHTNFDNWGEDKVQKMNIFPKVLNISLLLVKHLKHDELDSLPEYVKLLIYNE